MVEDQAEAVTFFGGGSPELSPSSCTSSTACFVLEVSRDTMLRRLDERLGDERASRVRPAERELATQLHSSSREDLAPGVPVDANWPLAFVVDEILRLCNACS